MELTDIKGVGPKTLKNLQDLNINKVEDLLTYFPFRYEIFEPISLPSDYNGERIAINAQAVMFTFFVKISIAFNFEQTMMAKQCMLLFIIVLLLNPIF